MERAMWIMWIYGEKGSNDGLFIHKNIHRIKIRIGVLFCGYCE